MGIYMCAVHVVDDSLLPMELAAAQSQFWPRRAPLTALISADTSSRDPSLLFSKRI